MRSWQLAVRLDGVVMSAEPPGEKAGRSIAALRDLLKATQLVALSEKGANLKLWGGGGVLAVEVSLPSERSASAKAVARTSTVGAGGAVDNDVLLLADGAEGLDGAREMRDDATGARTLASNGDGAPPWTAKPVPQRQGTPGSPWVWQAGHVAMMMVTGVRCVATEWEDAWERRD